MRECNRMILRELWRPAGLPLATWGYNLFVHTYMCRSDLWRMNNMFAQQQYDHKNWSSNNQSSYIIS